MNSYRNSFNSHRHICATGKGIDRLFLCCDVNPEEGSQKGWQPLHQMSALTPKSALTSVRGWMQNQMLALHKITWLISFQMLELLVISRSLLQLEEHKWLVVYADLKVETEMNQPVVRLVQTAISTVETELLKLHLLSCLSVVKSSLYVISLEF